MFLIMAVQLHTGALRACTLFKIVHLFGCNSDHASMLFVNLVCSPWASHTPGRNIVKQTSMAFLVEKYWAGSVGKNAHEVDTERQSYTLKGADFLKMWKMGVIWGVILRSLEIGLFRSGVVISQKSSACQFIVARKTRVGMVRILAPNAASLSQNARGIIYSICSRSCFPHHFLLVSRAFWACIKRLSSPCLQFGFLPLRGRCLSVFLQSNVYRVSTASTLSIVDELLDRLLRE